jgi:putative hydrolase of the HAD superfamily
MKKYEHIIFDLDHTLWDYERNSRITVNHLFQKHELEQLLKCSFTDYFKVYTLNTNRLWDLYNKKKINQKTLRKKRLEMVFTHFGYRSPNLEKELERSYIETCPYSPHLIDHTQDVLSELFNNHQLHLLTNGFKITQDIKLKTTDIKRFFQNIITSDDSGYSKPSYEAYNFLHQKLNAEKGNCLMVGDNLSSDIKGANDFGYDTCFFSPKGASSGYATYKINKLHRLLELV